MQFWMWVGKEELKCPGRATSSLRPIIGCEGTWTSTRGPGTPALLATSLLSSYKMLRQHKAACKLGRKHTCALCNKEYSSLQILKTHEKVQHEGRSASTLDSPSPAPHCGKAYLVKKSMREHVGTLCTKPFQKGALLL